ncbi:MAG: PEGA domain-containing protein [Patescibacteria group bacterium]
MDKKNNPLNFRLTRKIRLTVMITLISLFFVISPSIVLYTSGYRYNWREKRLEGTGVISIDAAPKEATVSLNGIKIDKKLPIWLPNIAPGVYRLSIEMPGYKQWSQDIRVSGNQTAYVKNISLIKDSEPKLLNTGAQKISAVFSPDGYGALTILQNDGVSYFLNHLNPMTGIITPIITMPTSSDPRLSVSPKKNWGVAIQQNGHKPGLTLFSLKEPYQELMSDYQNKLNYHWAILRDNPIIYIESDGEIDSMESDLEMRVVGASSSSVWYVDADSVVWSATGNTITNDKKTGTNRYDLDRPITQIIDINQSRMVLRYESGILVIGLRDGFNIKQTNIATVNKINYHPDTGEWWVWSDWELWSIYEDGSSFLLNRSSEKITNSLPMDNFGVALIVSGNSLYSFNPGYYNNQKIGTFDLVESVAINRELKKIYFSGAHNGRAGLFELDY